MGKTFCVYMHTNTVNGKHYIGQTCQNPPSARWGKDGHGYSSNLHFANAINKYGWEAFEHTIILTGLTLKEADMAESLLIEIYDTLNPTQGYNKKNGGNNGFMSEESKIKISNANKGRKKPDDFGTKISLAKMGHPVTEETRKILREKCSGRHHTTEECKKISDKNSGKHWYNNGIENVFAFKCPIGFVSGMLKQSKETLKKKSEYFKRTRWYTNGNKNIRAVECPDGFWRGRTKLTVGTNLWGDAI